MTRDSTLPDKLGDAVALLYGLDRDTLEFLHYSQNYVFCVQDRRGRSLIARLTEPDHRSREEILAELHWIDFLKTHGVRACGATQPHSREVCETVRVEGRDTSASFSSMHRGAQHPAEISPQPCSNSTASCLGNSTA